MQILYKFNGKEYTLEELAKKFPEEWEIAIKSEYHFWKKCTLYDIVVEASDEFEEILADNKSIYIEPIGLNDKYMDLNVLLSPIFEVYQ